MMDTLAIQHCSVTIVRESMGSLYAPFKTVQNSRDIVKLVHQRLKGKDREEFLAVFLDAKHHPCGWHLVSVGSLTMAIVHPREAFKAAILCNAAAVIFAHNHPSGDPTPSQEDRLLTQRLEQAGDILGIQVLDHVIVTDDPARYRSFADAGWMGGKES